MSEEPPRPPTRRAPLGEATRRVNNAQPESRFSLKTAPGPHRGNSRQDSLAPNHNQFPDSPLSKGEYPLQESQRTSSPIFNVANPRLSAISKDYATESNRNSQISTVSTNASDGKKIKSYIGPWKLGRTLGKGATARVRLARHAFTGQEAAIKIVQKKSAQISQAGSLAALDQAELALPNPADGTRRMPIGVEREVAIMKLIQHQNIMKLYDIWENRTEIYLVLEYVDGGELFGVITSNGRLHEEDAMLLFRQILAAVGYCHSLNICHRDLKPENILVTKDGKIKIADFGMAALHQTPGHKLQTSCGSPHYAAPEVIKGGAYRGDRTDIWSLGVILYATLAGRLPFDSDGSGKGWLDSLLNKIKKGSYDMSPDFTPEAADLIWRILQVNPRDRITMSQIWRHAAIRKYDYLDDYGGGYIPLSPNVKDCGRPVVRRSDINMELLRHLRSMWHCLTEKQLMDLLLSEEPNDQKLFYSLLLKYRDAQLENYVPDLTFSASDYHYVREQTLTKTYSTCHFTQPKSKSHGRQASRFTVISNAADTEHSYDPFKASRPQQLNSNRQADHAKITIIRNQSNTQESKDAASNKSKVPQASRSSASEGSDRGRQKLVPPPAFVSRSSLASSTRSKNSGSYMRAPVGHKRGVSFSHLRKRSAGSEKPKTVDIEPVVERHSNHTEVTDNGGDSLHRVERASTSYIKSKKNQATASQPLMSAARPGRASQLWSEDVRQLSSSLAMDCDEAFNRTTVIPDIEARENNSFSSLKARTIVRESSPLAIQAPATVVRPRLASLDSRPLPSPPTRTDSINNELLEARKQAELRKKSGGDESPGYLARLVSHIDHLMLPSSSERRTSSAPIETRRNVSGRPLPSIYEHHKEEDSPRRETQYDKYTESEYWVKNSRIASAPEPRETMKRQRDDRFIRSESGVRNTIRVVDPTSPSPVKVPAPLAIRKKSSQGGPSTPRGMFSPETARYSSKGMASGRELRQHYRTGSVADVGRINEVYNHGDQIGNDRNEDTVVKKKTTWFKRSSKDEGDFRMTIKAADTMPSQSSSNDTVLRAYLGSTPSPEPRKKFSLGRLFKKRSSKPDMSLGIDGYDDDESLPESIVDIQRHSNTRRSSNNDHPIARQIIPQQNWLATLFKVKPASKVICFSVAQRRARQEIVTILKEWKRYGIRELQVDKKRNIVFGRVAAKNYLDMKEVAFACEVMKVIEHGKKYHLSIARFTQELGAASSFHKVVETLETVLKCRGTFVADDRKRRMMIKTLNSA